jgi:hypothetical protein
MASDFQIFHCFEQAWEIYEKINPDKKPSSQKAFEVACRSGADPNKILDAVRIYFYESIGTDPQYRYQFGNFIREKYWEDYIDKFGSSPDYLARLKEQAEAAEALLKTWNEKCRDHWCPVLDIPTKMGLAKRAMQDEAFKKFWKEALDLAREIFYKPLHSSDIRSKINISFQWFSTLGEKHTVMRIVEGFYGKPDAGLDSKPRPKEISDEEEAEAIKERMQLWEEVFGPSKKRKKDSVEPEQKKEDTRFSD